MRKYLASPKHCEPITAEKPGTKCPPWCHDSEVAQWLLNESEPMGEKLVATYRGVAFVAQRTHPGRNVWHGYPEAWDKIEVSIKNRWKAEGKIKSRDLRTFKTQAALRDEFGGSL